MVAAVSVWLLPMSVSMVDARSPHLWRLCQAGDGVLLIWRIRLAEVESGTPAVYC